MWNAKLNWCCKVTRWYVAIGKQLTCAKLNWFCKVSCWHVDLICSDAQATNIHLAAKRRNSRGRHSRGRTSMAARPNTQLSLHHLYKGRNGRTEAIEMCKIGSILQELPTYDLQCPPKRGFKSGHCNWRNISTLITRTINACVIHVRFDERLCDCRFDDLQPQN